MTGLVVCTPLLTEHVALRSGLGRVDGGSSVEVVRTGMGPRRSSARAGRLSGASAVLVAGVAGGLDRRLGPGDVVVATEIRTADGAEPVRCDSAHSLEEALIRGGLTPHLGPVLCAPRLGGERSRAAMTESGVLAVEMESAYLAAACPGRPFAVLRVIVDTADAPLLRPGTVVRGIRSLRVLRSCAGAVAEWARTLPGTPGRSTYGVSGTVGAEFTPPREVI